MKLVVDGEIYQRQPFGGISRIYNEVLPRLCDLDRGLELTLITDGRLKQLLPVHKSIIHRSMPAYQKVLRPGRLWQPATERLKSLTRNWWVRPVADAVWQATFYTPPAAWSGRFVVTFYDLMEERYPQWFTAPRHDTLRVLKRRCAQTADVIICISRVTQQDVCSYYGVAESKTRVVRLAAQASFRRLSDEELGSFRAPAPHFFLYVGGRSPYKNFDFVLRAFSTWPERQDIALVVVGAPLTAAERDLVEALGITDRVHAIGHVDDAALCRLYNKAMAFVYPSLHEGFGIPLLEALGCGCPLVASRIPITLEVAGDLPFYFDPADECELHQAWSAALQHGRQADAVQSGIEHAQAYSWDATAAEFLTIYRDLDPGRGTTAG